MATDWDECRGGWLSRVFGSLRANPDYDRVMHLLNSWLVEFDKEGLPGREIGLDVKGNVLFFGPDDTNYGFWLDTNLKLEDFEGEEVDIKEFEDIWSGSRNEDAI